MRPSVHLSVCLCLCPCLSLSLSFALSQDISIFLSLPGPLSAPSFPRQGSTSDRRAHQGPTGDGSRGRPLPLRLCQLIAARSSPSILRKRRQARPHDPPFPRILVRACRRHRPIRQHLLGHKPRRRRRRSAEKEEEGKRRRGVI